MHINANLFILLLIIIYLDSFSYSFHLLFKTLVINKFKLVGKTKELVKLAFQMSQTNNRYNLCVKM